MRLLLIDGHYYVFRSFFAIQSLSNSKGQPTNAIYGFIKTVRRMVKDLQPDLAAIVWDQGLPKRRTELQPEYKQQRTEMPDLMVPQLDFIKDELTERLGFHGVCLPDTEADDLMATYCCEARRRGDDVVLATNDKDLFQLVDEHVKVYTTNKTDLATPKDTHALLGPEKVRTKWGVEPAQIGDVLALVGDSVDNIPGVPGLGPKGAAALIGEYGSVTELIEKADSIKKPALREKVQAARDQIIANREMVRLDLDLPLPVPLDDLRIRPRYAELLACLEWCEFKSLMDEIRGEAPKEVVRSQGELF
jgi:5'-3' exonuclease